MIIKKGHSFINLPKSLTFLSLSLLFIFLSFDLSLAVLQPDTNLSNADASFLGEDSGDRAGNSISSAGDINGDGLGDLLIGAPWDETNGYHSGKVCLVLGKSAADWGSDFNLANADASFLGEDSYDQAGYSVSSAGDVNGDGLDDFLIGAPFDETNGYNSGKVYLILGRAVADWGSDFNLANADASFLGEDSDDRAGESTSSAGDVNGDGLDDFLIGAPWDEGFGYAYGKTYLVLGRTTANWGTNFNLSNADASFLGEMYRACAGYSISSAGDINGDGLHDILIGAWGNSASGRRSNGKAYIILGRSLANWGKNFPLSLAEVSFIGEYSHDLAGQSVSSAGDVNGDGLDDFLIGAYGNDEGGGGAGQTYLILGRTVVNWGRNFNLSNSDASFIGESGNDFSGQTVAFAGDVNGDGLGDFLIGAFYNDEGGSGAGQSYLILGNSSLPWGLDFSLANSDASFIGENVMDWSGYPVSSAGDVNSDGADDFIIAAFLNDENGQDAGQVYLILGISPNRPPVADAGSDQTVIIGDLVTLNGSASSDPDGDPVTYAWTVVSVPPESSITTASLSDPTAVNPSFIPDVIGDYNIQLIVNDGIVDSDPDTVIITVLNTPEGPSQVTLVGSTLSFSDISVAGNTYMTTTNQAPSPPTGYKLLDTIFFEFTTDATMSLDSTVVVCIDAGESGLTLQDGDELMKYYEHPVKGLGWWPVTALGYPQDNLICSEEMDFISLYTIMRLINKPPIADAGVDQTNECTSYAGVSVILDGSGSTDPDSTPETNDDIVSFKWYEDYGLPTETLLGDGEIISVTIGLGQHNITLLVIDSGDLTDTDDVTVIVQDTTPPELSVTVSPDTIWPPNHKLVQITPSITVSDLCDPSPGVILSSITSNEPDNGTGDGNTTGDIVVDEDGNIFLRAERSGKGDGRIYTIIHTAVDASDNSIEAESTVTVPHDLGKGKK